MRGRYVLDSYALIAYLNDEEGADEVEGVLREAARGEAELFMHAVNLGEVLYIAMREEGELEALRILGVVKGYPMEIVDEIPESLLLRAARLKGAYRISYADAFAAATAAEKGAVLITGDPEFRELEESGEIEVMWI